MDSLAPVSYILCEIFHESLVSHRKGALEHDIVDQLFVFTAILFKLVDVQRAASKSGLAKVASVEVGQLLVHFHFLSICRYVVSVSYFLPLISQSFLTFSHFLRSFLCPEIRSK